MRCAGRVSADQVPFYKRSKLWYLLTGTGFLGSESALHALAEGYIRFTSEHAKLWSVVIEHHLPDGKNLPDWHFEKTGRLIGLVERALAPLFPVGQESARSHTGWVLWASLYGMSSLMHARKLRESEVLADMAATLITTFVKGLQR